MTKTNTHDADHEAFLMAVSQVARALLTKTSQTARSQSVRMRLQDVVPLVYTIGSWTPTAPIDAKAVLGALEELQRLRKLSELTKEVDAYGELVVAFRAAPTAIAQERYREKMKRAGFKLCAVWLPVTEAAAIQTAYAEAARRKIDELDRLEARQGNN